MIVRFTLVAVLVAIVACENPTAHEEWCARVCPRQTPPHPPPLTSSPADGHRRNYEARTSQSDPVPAPPPRLLPRQCPPGGYRTVPPAVGIYKLHAKKLPWWQASISCSTENAHLIIPESELEVRVALELMRRKNITTVHVGFHKENSTSYFINVLGKKMKKKQDSLWENKRRPEGIYGKKCTMLSKGGVAPSLCYKQYPYICQLTCRL